MERVPGPGEFYRHFKNKLYQVVTLAVHSETGEKMVVYQALYGDFSVYARPLAMFMEEVDREKYPEAEQQYRFEKVTLGNKEKTKQEIDEEKRAEDAKTEDTINPLLLSFLEAETYDEKLAILRNMKGKIGQCEVDSLYLSLDLSSCVGTVEEQLENLRQHLNMQNRFAAGRLRRS